MDKLTATISLSCIHIIKDVHTSQSSLTDDVLSEEVQLILFRENFVISFRMGKLLLIIFLLLVISNQILRTEMPRTTKL